MARPAKVLVLATLLPLLLTATGCPIYFDSPWGHGRKRTAARPAENPPDVGLELRRQALPEFTRAGGAKLFDVDNDGAIEIVVPGMEGQIYILDRNGKGIEQVRLQRRQGELFSDQVAPLNFSGATYWLCTDMEIPGQANINKVSYRLTLYRRDGKRLWQRDLDTGGQHAIIEVRHGRLRDKSHHEIVLVIQLMGRFDQDGMDFAPNMKSRVLVFDAADGAPLARRTVDDLVRFSGIIPAATPDGLDSLVIGVGDDIVTCTLSAESTSMPAASRPATP